MDILLIGAGVIGTAYGANLASCGSSIDVYAHGDRAGDIAKLGLRATDIGTGNTLHELVQIVSDSAHKVYDLVLVSVRQEQLPSTFPILNELRGKPTVLCFGNNPAGYAAFGYSGFMGARNVTLELGFPGIGGSLSAGIVKYIRIPQQPTIIQASASTPTLEFARMLQTLGFKVANVSNIEGWLLYHAVFVACVAKALYRSGNDPLLLSGNRPLLQLMCSAITEGFDALKKKRITGAPGNLAFLHQRWMRAFAVWYWKRTFRSPMGELCFAAHARHAKLEMQELALSVRRSLAETKRPIEHLRDLLSDNLLNPT